MTWQLTDDLGTPVVRERYWITFQPGEIRVCASCHGINTFDQSGGTPPTNEPEALRGLLQHWKTNLAGQTFHVATTGSDGTGDGSSGNPWATIQHALGQVDDGSTILVAPGTYTGRNRLIGDFTNGVTVRSEVPYAALLRHDSTVVTAYDGRGITLEGFDIAHTPGSPSALVIQVQDLIGDPGGTDAVERIVFRNNIIHDSYNNDLLKINNGARNITVEGNLFYNQQGSDEHIDINGVENIIVRDNVFFNDFAGSGRTNNNDTSAYIVIKNSGGHPINRNFTIQRNIFLNWEGSSGSPFLLFGEDGQPFYEAEDGMVENNLFLGNSQEVMRAAWGVKGSRNITFRNNTVSGDLPARAYAMRLNTEGQNLANENIRFFNNIWSDDTGTMGAGDGQPNDFSDTPAGETNSFTLDNNLYWNGGTPIPESTSDIVNYTDDASRVVADPGLPDLNGLVLPRYSGGSFLSGNTTIREEFERLARAYATPGTAAVVDQASATNAPADDLLGNTRDGRPDIGALEVGADDPCSTTLLQALPGWPGETILDLIPLLDCTN